MFGDWYWIGVAVGFGVALGVLAAGLVATPRLRLVAVVLAAAAGFVAGLAVAGFDFGEWGRPLAGALAGPLGVAGAEPLVAGTLARGGTRGGTAAIVAGAAFVVAALGLIPGVGYVEAVALPALGARLRSAAGRRHAGLRVLARD